MRENRLLETQQYCLSRFIQTLNNTKKKSVSFVLWLICLIFVSNKWHPIYNLIAAARQHNMTVWP